MAVNEAGNIVIADSGNNIIREVDADTGVIRRLPVPALLVTRASGFGN